MKSVQELREFYETTLLDDLRELEAKRKKIVRKLLYVGLGIGAAIVGVCLMLGQVFIQKPMALLFPVVIGGLIFGLVYRFSTKGYVSQFKAGVIRKIVTFVDNNLSYNEMGRIEQAIFMMSEIFKKRPDRYRGDDLVRGKMGATAIEFSEVHAEYKTETRDSKGRRQTHWHTIFKGLFFVGDFNKNFKGRTVVLPDTAEKLFGRIGQLLQSWNVVRDELIKLEDPEFEKAFAVYGNDQIEARYILSTSLMQRIVGFKEKTGRRIYLSFVGSKVFVAVTYRKNLFEPRVFKTLLDFGPIQEYFEDLQLAIGIVDDLNLNLRIWGKQ